MSTRSPAPGKRARARLAPRWALAPAAWLPAALAWSSGCSEAPAIPGDVKDDAGPASAGDAGRPDAAIDPGVPPEVDGRITINEFMTANAVTTSDGAGVASDWVELFNPTDQDIPLHGYGLTDDLAEPHKATISDGVVLPAGGHLVLWLDGSPALGATHLGFRLRREGGEVGLARPDWSYIDRLTYAMQEVDFSAAREPDGSDRWRVEWHASPAAANPSGDGASGGYEEVEEPPEAVPGAGDLSELILGYGVVPEFQLLVSAAAVDSLEVFPFTYVPAELVFAGRAYGPVGLRLKGQNSFEPFSQKPSLRINVDQYVANARFFGLKDLTLNNMDNDLSMMHERLAYFVARAAGIPASRSNHALLTVNGQFYGLYANVETVKARMVARWFTDASGPLFEGTDVDFTAGYVADYELESGPDDRSLLVGLASALTIVSPDDAILAAAAYANLDQFRRYWAMCAVVGQFDSFPYSNPGDDYLLYADPASGLLWFMPWGMDETFYSSSYDVTAITSVMARKCRDSPACFEDFAEQAWEILDQVEAMDLDGEVARVRAEIAPYVASDTRKPYTTETVNGAQASMSWFVGERRSRLGTMLPPPGGQEPP